MDEKKKFTFAIIFGLVGLWFVFTNFCLPTLKDNTLRLTEYRKLKEDTKTIAGFTDEKFKTWDEKLTVASGALEEKFLSEGKMKLAERLTRPPKETNIVFLDIKQRETEIRNDYEVFPVDISIRSQFLDLIRYLAMIESSPLFIGLDSLRVTKSMPEAKDLDIRLTFAGFRLAQKPRSASSYLEERFRPFNEANFKNLVGTIASRKTISFDLIAGLYNPFLSVYEPGQDRARLTRVAQGFTLKGTLRVEGKHAALINDQIVREGQFVDGAEVVQIGDGRVVLMRSGRREILKMGVKDGFIQP